jgi:anti-anti-sigma regulatory factor
LLRSWLVSPQRTRLLEFLADFSITNIQPIVKDVLDITGFSDILNLS